LPEAVANAVNQTLKRTDVNCAIFAGAVFPAFDEPAVPEDTNVLGHRRLTATEFFVKLVQVFFALMEHLQNADPHRVGDRFQQLGNFQGFICSQILHVAVQFRWLNA